MGNLCCPQVEDPEPIKYIMCVGMCVLDIVHVCSDYPVENTDQTCLEVYRQRGGNASNCCTVLSLLGAKCEFFGVLSDSKEYAFLDEDFLRYKIAIDHCPRTTLHPPFSSVIRVKRKASRTILHYDSPFEMLKFEMFESQLVKSLTNYSWIHFEAYNTQQTQLMINLIHAYNIRAEVKITISVNLERELVEYMVLAEIADVVFLGKCYALYMGWQNSKEAVFQLRESLETNSDYAHKPIIICSWGAHGVSCLDNDNTFCHLPPAPPRQIVDTLGAGDTFIAATIYALNTLKFQLTAAVDFGNLCASFKLGHQGYDDIARFMASENMCPYLTKS